MFSRYSSTRRTVGSRATHLPAAGLAFVCWLILVLCTSIPRVALAQAPEPGLAAADLGGSDKRAEAQQHFERGLALARTQSWDAALSEFTTSCEKFPTRSAKRNVAIVLQRLGRYVEALGAYEALLQQFSGAMSADEVERLRGELSAVIAQTGEATLDVDQADAAVFVDGQARGVTPLANPLRLNPGEHSLRLTKIGFEPRELRFSVSRGERARLGATLLPQVGVGTLSVEEGAGARADVLVDEVLVGQTPWKGSIAPGLHSVRLRGPADRGTAPRAVVVKLQKASRLSLMLVDLGAELNVQTTPAYATIFVDGVNVGSEAWRGRLSTGEHRVDVTAPGYLPFQAQLSLPHGSIRRIAARLEPGPDDRPTPPRPRYAELALGLLLGRSLGGSADDACGCSERQRPFGGLAGARFGYGLGDKLAVELGASYLSISESMQRLQRADGEERAAQWLAKDYRDATRLSGPAVTLGVAFRWGARVPVTTRLSAGLAWLRSHTENAGTFAGEIHDEARSQQLERFVDIPEMSPLLVVPYAATEFRWGYRFTKRWSADLGLALVAFFPTTTHRVPVSSFKGREDRTSVLEDQPTDIKRPGVLTLPREAIAGAFLVASPSIALRLAF